MKKNLLTLVCAVAVVALASSCCNNKQDADTQNDTAMEFKPVAERVQMGAKTYVTPQPALMIATYDADGTPNVMMAAWGGQCDANRVCFCLSHHKTTDNLRLNRAFTLSYADARTVVESDYFGIESGLKNADKVARAGFTATPSQNVNAPIIDQYPLAMECRVVEMRDDENGGAFVIGEIVGAVADPAILTDGKIDIRKLNPVAWDASSLNYLTLGDSVGQAWNSGRAIMEK